MGDSQIGFMNAGAFGALRRKSQRTADRVARMQVIFVVSLHSGDRTGFPLSRYSAALRTVTLKGTFYVSVILHFNEG